MAIHRKKKPKSGLQNVLITGLIFLVGTVILAVYQNFELAEINNSLRRESFLKKQEVTRLKKEIDDLNLKMRPFFARADHIFPEAAPDSRLNLLVARLDEATGGSNPQIPAAVHDRTISKFNRLYISNRLKSIEPYHVGLECDVNDPEACSLATQIKAIFETAGWQSGHIDKKPFHSPAKEMTIEFSDQPPKTLQEALLPLYDHFGYRREGILNPDLPEKSMRIIVGSR